MEARAVKKVVAVAGDHLEFINKINGIIRNEQNQRIALTTIMSKHKPRIFQSGQDATGAKIGTYGTNPISISAKNQARATGKTYFKGGYAEYKKDVGKNPGFVILRNTDQMMMDYGILRSGSGWGFGFQNSTNAEKSDWMQTKYDKEIFALSDPELNLLGDVLLDQINKGT